MLAKAGNQKSRKTLDTCIRGNDEKLASDGFFDFEIVSIGTYIKYDACRSGW